MRQQLADAVIGVCQQALQYVLEVRPRIVPVELGRLQQAHHHRVAIAYRLQIVYVKFVGTHQAYDEVDAETIESA